MPIYEYRCHKCGSVFELLQKFSDPPIQKHEECGGDVERLISRSGFQLKGGGWYVTDYAKGSGGSGEKSASSDAKPGSAPAESKTASESKSSESKTSESKPTDTKPA